MCEMYYVFIDSAWVGHQINELTIMTPIFIKGFASSVYHSRLIRHHKYLFIKLKVS